MGIVGHHPETGVRIDVERPQAEGPPWRYEGEAVTPSARFRVAASVAGDGAVTVELQQGAPAGLAEQARRVEARPRGRGRPAAPHRPLAAGPLND